MQPLLLLALIGQTPTTPATIAATAPIVIPKGTPVQLAVVHELSSHDSKVGDKIAFAVAENVVDAAGHVLIAKGVSVEGTVTAVESQPRIDHLKGLIGVATTVVHLPGGTDVPMQIQQTDPQNHDFRTRQNQVPPSPTVVERTTFYATKQPQAASNLMQTVAAVTGVAAPAARGATTGGTGATGGTPPAGGAPAAAATVFQDPLTESSAVLLSQIVDFKQSQSLLQSVGQSNLVVLVQNLGRHEGFSSFARKFSTTSAVTMVGAGVGLFKLAGLGSSLFFQHVSIAPGALFHATTGAECTVQVPVPPGPRGPWHAHVRILAPRHFANRRNRTFTPNGKAPSYLHRKSD